MTIDRLLGGRRLVAIDKISGRSYLHAIFAAWRAGDVIMPVNEGAALPDVGVAIAEHVVPQAGGGWFDETLPPDAGDAPAQISMTSGTTGEPKAILLSRRALSDVTQRLIDIMAMDASIREYLGVPVTYSFGLGRARAIAAVGGKAYLPEHGFRVDELAAMLRAGEVNALSAVPTLLRLLLAQRALIADAGGALRWLEIGSQYMSGAEKAQIRALFPNARIVQHYGLTEASRSTFLRIDGAPEATLESVGAATGDVKLRIDADGRICVSGPHVADGRIVDGALAGLTDADGWLHTSDKGAIEADLLFYHGRADDVLNVSGVKVSAEHFEEKLRERTGVGVLQMAVTGKADPLRGQSVVVAHLPAVAPDPLRAAAQAVAAEAGLGAADVSLACVDEIPMTETGKIRRNLLAERIAAAAPETSAPVKDSAASGMSPSEAEIARIWREALGVTAVRRDDSFFDIGGDSLSAITVALRAEQHGMPGDVMRLMFEGRTVAEIAALLDGAEAATIKRSRNAILGDTINATRGVLVLTVIFSHWAPFFFVRLGDAGLLALHYLQLFVHIGTAGFAMIFGVGLSFFYLPMAERHADRLRERVRNNALVLAAGVLAIAAVNAVIILINDGGFSPYWTEQLFFTVITSYFLLMLSVPLLLRFVRMSGYVIFNALVLATLGVIALLLLTAWLTPMVWTGPANFARLMLITHYSYPQMVAAASIGMAIGHWLRTQSERPDLTRAIGQLGLLLVVNGVLFLLLTGGLFAHLQGVQFFPFYAGILLLIITLFFWMTEQGRGQQLRRLLMLLGLLAFPAFVTHVMVIPLKDIMVALGVPYVAALGLALLSFVALTLYGMARFNRLYFARG